MRVLYGIGQRARRMELDGAGNGINVIRRRTAASPCCVEKARPGKACKVIGHIPRGLIVLPEGVGQSRVQMGTEVAVASPRQILQEGSDLLEPAPAIAADYEGSCMGDGLPKGLPGLPREQAAAGVGEGGGDHDG